MMKELDAPLPPNYATFCLFTVCLWDTSDCPVLEPGFQNSRTTPPWCKCAKASIVIVGRETRSRTTVLQGAVKTGDLALQRSKANGRPQVPGVAHTV
jgi:hypothetical protein